MSLRNKRTSQGLASNVQLDPGIGWKAVFQQVKSCVVQVSASASRQKFVLPIESFMIEPSTLAGTFCEAAELSKEKGGDNLTMRPKLRLSRPLGGLRV
eukprot:1342867-Amphidinium_carterae.1